MGGFQLYWSDDGHGMVGKFVGKDSQNHINHGIWIWARDMDALSDLAYWAATAGGYEFDSAKFIEVLNSVVGQASVES